MRVYKCNKVFQLYYLKFKNSKLIIERNVHHKYKSHDNNFGKKNFARSNFVGAERRYTLLLLPLVFYD